MKPLYKITEDMKGLQLLAENEELDHQTIVDTMDGINESFNDKAISLIHVVNTMGDDVEIIKNEIARLSERKKIIENKQDSMKEYLRINMEASGIKKIICPIFTITLKAGRDIIQIGDEEKIPSDYLNIKTTMTPMKREILAALKEGKDIPGAIITKSKSSILVK